MFFVQMIKKKLSQHETRIYVNDVPEIKSNIIHLISPMSAGSAHSVESTFNSTHAGKKNVSLVRCPFVLSDLVRSDSQV